MSAEMLGTHRAKQMACSGRNQGLKSSIIRSLSVVRCVSIKDSMNWHADTAPCVPQNWFPGGRVRNSTFGRRFIIVSIIIFPSLAIALGVPGKSADIVTATGDAHNSCTSCSVFLCRVLDPVNIQVHNHLAILHYPIRAVNPPTASAAVSMSVNLCKVT